MSKKKVTIHSDGTPGGTVLLDEDGNTIDNVTDLNMHISYDSVMEVDMTLRIVPVIAQGEVGTVTVECPGCGEDYEHQCSLNMGGSNSPFVSAVQQLTTNPVPGIPGTPISSNGRCNYQYMTHTCSFPTDVSHTVHVDLNTGFAWAASGRAVTFMFGPGLMPVKL